MPLVFADTSYWQGRFFPQDQWHQAALAAERRLRHPLRLLTTQEVLTEFLASVSGNQYSRRIGVRALEEIHSNPRYTVAPQSADSFHRGFEIYRNRMDKGYSLVDCVSMNTMDDYGITQVLTSDHHFEQESRYVALMRRQH
jgi:predicted nucleic acid-binding protein